jgi:hypothetical protein
MGDWQSGDLAMRLLERRGELDEHFIGGRIIAWPRPCRRHREQTAPHHHVVSMALEGGDNQRLAFRAPERLEAS